MKRAELIQLWHEIQVLQESASPSDQAHALGLIDDLADALADKVLILDAETCLYVFNDDVIVAELFP